MTHLDLFSGIGAFTLAAQRSGIDTIYLSEINKHANKVLAKNFPNIPNLGSVTEIDGTWLHAIDLVTGGFPCTDLSQSAKGSHEGLEGKESGLFYELARIVLECDHKWVVIGNVPQVMKYMDQIKKEMFFHDWDARIFEAGEYGANCRRKRAFIVGCSVEGGARKVLDLAEKHRSTLRSGRDEDAFPMCLPWKGGVSLERLGSCVLEFADISGGFADQEVNPTRIRKGDGLSRGVDGHRYLMLGNSITPVIPTIIFKELMAVENDL
jgi:DNA (cytosine-5)-methyltransferase 1